MCKQLNVDWEHCLKMCHILSHFYLRTICFSRCWREYHKRPIKLVFYPYGSHNGEMVKGENYMWLREILRGFFHPLQPLYPNLTVTDPLLSIFVKMYHLPWKKTAVIWSFLYLFLFCLLYIKLGVQKVTPFLFAIF